MSKEKIESHDERLRSEFKTIMNSKQGQKEVKELVGEAQEYLKDIDLPEGYQKSAQIAIEEAVENRKLYFQHYSIIKQFVEFERKLNNKNTDNDYIIW